MMLVLSRKRYEEIRIGRDVLIRVVQIKGNQVQIGIVAPADQRIVRTELEQDQKAA